MTGRKLSGFVLVALACTVGAALLFASVRPASPPVSAAGAAEAGAPAARTPLWSARRDPVFFERATQSAAQARAATALTQQLTAITAPVHACVAVDGPVGPLARVNADLALAPASTLKLLTATTAIDRLGPEHRFTTQVVQDSTGDLIVVGGGDPLLATPEHIAYEHGQLRFREAPYTALTTLADAVAAAGVHQVSGALLVDDHVHDTLRYLPDWKPIYGQEGDVGSLGALTVDGGFANTNGTAPAADPALTTGQRLAALLIARGITIAGGVRRGAAPADAHEIAHVDSAPLSAIVGEMLTSSDNYTAEELLRDIARDADPAVPATSATGSQIVAAELTKLGVSTAGLVLHDGSGLAPVDRVSCTTMLQVIELSAQPKFAAIDKGLAIAAETGTLAGRFGGGPLAGKLRAKTGSIGGVVGLVGVVDGPDELHFAFIANGDFSDAAGAQLQTEVGDAVGSTPDLRPPAGLVPAP